MKVMFVMGTRPEVIKLAPVLLEARRRGLETVCVVTAQHREMLDMMMDVWELRADHDLDLMKPGQTMCGVTSEVLRGLDGVIEDERPDAVLVQGDTVTTFAGALAAFYRGVRVGHVEAGLRSGNRWSPYPEEMMRCLTTRLSEWHFCPTKGNEKNLLDEGVPKNRCFVTGNTVIDALKSVVRQVYMFQSDVLNSLDFEKRKVVVLTSHRRENLGDTMRDVLAAIRKAVEERPEVDLVFPVHPNPAVRRVVEKVFEGARNVYLIDPLDYVEFANLMARCYMVLTDSGGIQEEAPFLGKPVVVLRRETERPEAVDAGTVAMAGVDPDRVYDVVRMLLRGGHVYDRMSKAISPYGDGFASQRIVEILRKSVENT